MRILAHILSIVFHPILMILYFLMILVALDPYDFVFPDAHSKIVFFVYSIVNSLVIPFVAIMVMKMLGIVKTLQMEGKKERIGPLIVVGSLYLWLFITFKNSPGVPDIYLSFILGSVFGVFVAFFINNFSKISLHAVGMGGFVLGMFFLKMESTTSSIFLNLSPLFNLQLSTSFLLIIAIVVAGLVATSRLILKAHKPADIYGGFLLGALSQIIAFNIIY